MLSQSSNTKFPKNSLFFLQANDVDSVPNNLAWGLLVRTLRDNSDTGIALEVTAGSNWAADSSVVFDQAIELMMLKGSLTIGEFEMRSGDFLRIERDSVIARPTSVSGVTFLLFIDNGNPTVSVVADPHAASMDRWLFVSGEASPWVAGTAMAEVGRDDVPLKIKHFKQDSQTGARTYLVAVQPGISIPWEKHDVAEEAYIVEGDYRLAECIDGNAIIGDYVQGGYFYRPPGIAHNGPESGSKTGAVMLIRTPAPLTVILVDGC